MSLSLRLGVRHELKQEIVPKLYGGLLEEVPPHLNRLNEHIMIDGEPFDSRFLLFRDLTDGIRHSHGSPLTTRKMAAELLSRLESMASTADRELRAMVRRVYSSPEPNADSDLYFDP